MGATLGPAQAGHSRNFGDDEVPKSSVEAAAAALYDPALPYHNFSHALAVSEESRRIVDRCRAGGVVIDADVVHYASLLHDAGFREDHEALGFDSTEAYSAHLADGVLERCGIDATTIAAVREAILSTHIEAHCASPEARAVRAADLAGLGGDYEDFRSDSVRLLREYELMSGEHVSWERWRQEACDRISEYLREPVDLTPADMDADGEAILVKRARENMRRLLAEPLTEA
jgi:predicted metal-dependent HD superfamily phosphohydrolase